MNKVFCDRCGQECIEGSAYFTIDIYGFDTNPTNDGRTSLDAAAQNIATNVAKVMGTQKHYCKKCKDEIEQYINTNPSGSMLDATKAKEELNEIIRRTLNKDN